MVQTRRAIAGWCVLGVGLLLAAAACSEGEDLLGTVLEPSRPAVTFKLTNQHGDVVDLADHRGSVVALTFLYTNCPDICPIVASHLRQAHRLLGDAADEVSIVAVTVDPDRDSVEAAYEYSDKWQMLRHWDYLVGDKVELVPIWQAYYLDPIADLPHGDETDDAGAAQATRRGGTAALARDIVTAYTVSHAGPVYLIDRAGDMKALFTLPFDPKDLAHDIRLLIAEEG
jgi:protein SCO1/2